MELRQVNVNEIYGPVLQGEGPDIGRPCFFLRLHHCPVKCPGCDTAYTWNGSESGERLLEEGLRSRLEALSKDYPKCGLVVTGGEPLIYMTNSGLADVLHWWRFLSVPSINRERWVSLETSGFAGRAQVNPSTLWDFLRRFNTVVLSPKITPCLRGQWSRDDLLTNVRRFMDCCNVNYPPPKLVLKFVVRDGADYLEVLRTDEEYGFSKHGFPVYLMPFGQEPAEIIRTIDSMIPFASRHGYIVSPRLHSLMYGKERLR